MADVNVLIAFYSRTGVTEALAKASAEGAERQGAEVRLRRAREFVSPEIMAKATGWAEVADSMNERHPAPSAADAEWPTRSCWGRRRASARSRPELKAYIDSLGGLWPLAHLGFIIVPTGYADASSYKAGTPYGASSVSNNQARPPSADDLEVARFQGRRVTDVAKALKHSGVK